tara:strand:- start:205 stop:1083 length:879 start_codon:yes stop_codon:yes gene_type:complete
MNISKINEHILKEHTKTLENILTNISIHYNINKKELFETFLYTKNNTKKYKNKKKDIDPQYICMAKIKTGDQCSRSKKFGDYCGKHSIHKNTCPNKGYIPRCDDATRPNNATGDKQEKTYQGLISSGCFECSCSPKLGRITKKTLQSNKSNKTNKSTPISSNHIIVQTETIQNNTYHVENDTQIVFDTNIKHPTVIGKKLSENEIFFLSDIDPETPVSLHKHKTITKDTDTIHHVDNITNDISTLLSKHSDSNLVDDFNNFNTLEHNIHTYKNTKEDEEDMVDDINEELGLY